MEWELYFVQGVEILFLGIGSYFDVRDHELPIVFLLIFGVLGIFCNIFLSYQSIYSLLAGGCIGIIFLCVSWITKEAIGYGDGIGIAILGILAGWKQLLLIIFLAFLLSGIYGIWKLIGLRESAESTMPFFPFLFAAMTGVIFL